ncbi:hypothetical protein AWJ20_4692 [Sugiyamaella lignohabitans]|uniref:C3H1-type domain-containing protein n=1 Tax=Sugiyamaella lignohabitans TaxID=796027 RepID=A0A167E7T7_9ASCO|nr:uncharacterized protein AWJ20_4692 [Sugiyamaella lignohabitans]ANB13748.1 hypothetical protein AWJ20_4692 [Sugiyamaella lignohabitans]
MKVAPGALVCRWFALDGYCDTGDKCDKRHVFECPDFEATGQCHRKKCPLKHILRAKEEGKFETHDVTNTTEDSSLPIDLDAVIDMINAEDESPDDDSDNDESENDDDGSNDDESGSDDDDSADDVSSDDSDVMQWDFTHNNHLPDDDNEDFISI